MKKLFISCPMKGRTKENIEKSMDKMHRIAEAVFDEKLEVIPTYIEDRPPQCNHEAVWYLGESIKLLAQADYFIGLDRADGYPGCNIEREVVKAYKIPAYGFPMGTVLTKEEVEEFEHKSE